MNDALIALLHDAILDALEDGRDPSEAAKLAAVALIAGISAFNGQMQTLDTSVSMH